WPEREPTSVTHTILSDLNRVVEFQERAKAEAEDKAKLKAEALELVNAWREAGNSTPLTDWGTLLGTSVGDYWLAVARKAREIARTCTVSSGGKTMTCEPTCRHQCPSCRMGLVTHLTCDPHCIDHKEK